MFTYFSPMTLPNSFIEGTPAFMNYFFGFRTVTTRLNISIDLAHGFTDNINTIEIFSIGFGVLERMKNSRDYDFGQI